MPVPTRPNPIYLSQRGDGRVRRNLWEDAIRKVKHPGSDLEVFEDYVADFSAGTTRRQANREVPGLFGYEKRAWNAVRKEYWKLRVRNGLKDGGGKFEFNEFNIKWAERDGRPPIGPDGLWMELDHKIERCDDIRLAFDAENIIEVFYRQHTFKTPEVFFRWFLEPKSPHDPDSWIQKELSTKPGLRDYCGDPLDYDIWP